MVLVGLEDDNFLRGVVVDIACRTRTVEDIACWKRLKMMMLCVLLNGTCFERDARSR